jgi:hypothetical protein
LIEIQLPDLSYMETQDYGSIAIQQRQLYGIVMDVLDRIPYIYHYEDQIVKMISDSFVNSRFNVDVLNKKINEFVRNTWFEVTN